METENTFWANSKIKGIICYSCGIPGHKASKCRGRKTKEENFVTFANTSHNNKTCRKSQDKTKAVDDALYSYAFKVIEKDFYLPCDKTFLVDCGAAAHIVNYDALHKKWNFLLRISSVNVTKSAGNCGFDHIYWRSP